LKTPLVDTDVWIDFLRGVSQAVHFVDQLPDVVCISAISVAELYAGVREGKERVSLEDLLTALKILPLDDISATHGGLIRRDFGKSHDVGLSDALIAATALQHDCQLFTLNVKHYPALPKTQVTKPYVKTTHPTNS
jgi:predicted nucleic acid-binding protein